MKEKIRWPKKGDNPFLVKAADPNSPTWVSLNWIVGLKIDDSSLSIAFKECADKIINDLERGEDIKHPDIYFIPIAYLYRHSLELKMKQIIRLALNLHLLKQNERILEDLEEHSLYPLWNHVKLSAITFWPEVPTQDLSAVERVIQSIHQIDKSGQDLRYTKNSTGESTLITLPDSVDLIHFKDVFEGVFNLLDGCEDSFYDAFQTMCRISQDYTT